MYSENDDTWRPCCACYRETRAAALKTCSVCENAWYCGVACQKTGWPLHKAICTQIATTLLIDAVHSNDKDTVKRLAKTRRVLNGKVDYTERDDDPITLGQWTALHDCVREDNTTMMEILIENGANLEIKDIDGETPVFVACSSRDPALALMLLRAGANPNAKARDGWSCLMMAGRKGSYEVTKGLLEAGADVYDGHDDFGRDVVGIVNQMRSGQDEEGMRRYERIYALLNLYYSEDFIDVEGVLLPL